MHIRVITFNCNGIRSADKKSAAEILGEFQPDYLFFQETRCQTDQIPGSFLPGKIQDSVQEESTNQTQPNPPGPYFCDYFGAWNSAEKKGYSGVGSLVRHEGEFSNLTIGDSVLDSEGRVQCFRTEKVTFLNCYFPSGTAGSERQILKMSFLPKIRKTVEDLATEGKPILFLGDFNIAHNEVDLKNWKANRKKPGFLPEERQWLDELREFGFSDVVRSLAGEEEVYSWWSQRSGARDRNVGWRIDYQWLWDPDRILEPVSFQIPRLPVISDHAPVIVDYRLKS